MPTFYQHVRGHSQLHPGLELQQSAVVAHALHRVAAGTGEIAGDEVELAHLMHLPLAAVAQGIQYKHGNVHIEFFTIFGHAKIAAVHGASRCA